MRKAFIRRSKSGHWVATFATDGVTTKTMVVGGPGDTSDIVARRVEAKWSISHISFALNIMAEQAFNRS